MIKAVGDKGSNKAGAKVAVQVEPPLGWSDSLVTLRAGVTPVVRRKALLCDTGTDAVRLKKDTLSLVRLSSRWGGSWQPRCEIV